MLEAFVFSDFKPKIEIKCFEVVSEYEKFQKALDEAEKIEREKEANFRRLIDTMQIEMLRQQFNP